ncbi:unnamed protein product, partial [Prunus brigantina]
TSPCDTQALCCLRHRRYLTTLPCDMQPLFLCLRHPRAQLLHPATCNFVPSATPSPSAPSCQVLSLPNILLTRGLRGLWAVHYTAWKMNNGVARPVHLKLQVPNQEVPSYSRTWGTTVCTITNRATNYARSATCHALRGHHLSQRSITTSHNSKQSKRSPTSENYKK